MSDVVPSSLVDVESSPLSSELWGLAYLFLADWQIDLVLDTSYTTDVAIAETVAESRIGLVRRPYRTLRARAISFNREESLGLKMLLMRMAHARNLVPLYTDQSVLTAPASGTTLDCDTTNRRFQENSRVVVAVPSVGFGSYESFEVAEIQSVSASQITLKASLSGSFPTGSRVMPLVEARLLLNHSQTFVTDKNVEARLVFVESTGEMSLLPTAEPGATPSGFPVADDGLPIMDRSFNWTFDVSGQVIREGKQSQLGRDMVTQVFGERARQLHAFAITSTDRDGIYQLLRFFESRAGRLHPFWILSAIDDYEPTAISSGGVNVKAVGPEFDWNFRPYLAVELNNGTIYIREVDSVTRVGSSDNVSIVGTFPGPPSLSDVRSVRIAYRVRFFEDAMSEAWTNDEVVTANLSALEVLEEKSVELDNIDNQPTGRQTLDYYRTHMAGGFVWPTRPFTLTQPDVTKEIYKLEPPAIAEFSKDGSADRIGVRFLFRPFPYAIARGAWIKFWTDYASTFDLTFRLEDEDTGDVLAEVAVDEVAIVNGIDADNLENYSYFPFDDAVAIYRDRWYRLTVEAAAWADFHPSYWSGAGDAEYHLTQRIAGTWTPTPADVLALALFFENADFDANLTGPE